MFDRIKNYITLIPKALKHAPQILEGIVNSVRLDSGTLPVEEQDEIIKRRVICRLCPFNSDLAKTSSEYQELYNGQHYNDGESRPDFHCAICACNIDWKTAALDETCGISFYNDINWKNRQPLKWNKFKKQTNAE